MNGKASDSDILQQDGAEIKTEKTRKEVEYQRKSSQLTMENQMRLQKSAKLKRLVEKSGNCNVLHKNVPRRGDFLRDGFTTLIDLKWRWVLLIFAFTYVIGWLVFAGLWYALAWDHGDIDYREKDTEWEPCVANVDNFISAFLFSVETQTTIGYGFRSVTEACWMGAVMVVVQSVFSCLVDAVMIGCIFAKLARPKKRAATIKFSKHACIAERDGRLCLMFRVGDIRQSHMYDVKIRAQLVKPRITIEGECIPIESYKLTFGPECSPEEKIFLVWPMIIVHEIDEESPLYELSAPMLKDMSFEIIIILEGVLEQTGLIMQARTSYLPSEICWGHRFSSQLITPSRDQEHLMVDYREFNSMKIVADTMDFSAKERDLLRSQGIDYKCENPTTTRSVLKKSYSFENSRRIKELHGNGFVARGKGNITFTDEIQESEEEGLDDHIQMSTDAKELINDHGFSESLEEQIEDCDETLAASPNEKRVGSPV